MVHCPSTQVYIPQPGGQFTSNKQLFILVPHTAIPQVVSVFSGIHPSPATLHLIISVIFVSLQLTRTFLFFCFCHLIGRISTEYIFSIPVKSYVSVSSSLGFSEFNSVPIIPNLIPEEIFALISVLFFDKSIVASSSSGESVA